MHTESVPNQVDVDPALASDKKFLIAHVAKALSAGGYSFGFPSASSARKARRRIYHVIGQMAEFDQKQMDLVEFQLKGRMIVFQPKRILSSAIIEESAPCPDTTSGGSIETPSLKQG